MDLNSILIVKKFIVNFFLKKQKRRVLRRMMRGYEILRKSQKLDLLIKIKEELTNLNFDQAEKYSSKLIFGTGNPKAELITRQFLITRLLGVDFNKHVLIALSHPEHELSYPLPPEWRKVIEQYGLKTQTFINRLYWLGYKLFFILFGFLNVASLLYLSIKSLLKKEVKHATSSAYFYALTEKNLPNPNMNGVSQDIVSWYLNWPGRISDLTAIFHTVRGKNASSVSGIPMFYTYSAIPTLTGIRQLLSYLFWTVQATLICLKDLFTSGFFNSILFSEGVKAAAFRYGKMEKIERDYLFHNSGWIYRPLWTYEAEKMGARILFYFYSTNCESFKLSEGDTIQANSWQVMSWPKYLVWDQFQADFVERAVGINSDIQIVGPIWFHSEIKSLPEMPSKSIAVFDIQPHRDSRYQSLGLENEYYTPKTMNNFLEDIQSVANKYQYSIILKRKRHIGKLLNSRYQNVLNKLEKKSNFLSIDPDISAFYLIQECPIVISIPFTSTAIIARELGKRTVYYDPTGMIQKDDRAAHGIEIVTGKLELMEWMEKQSGTLTGQPAALVNKNVF